MVNIARQASNAPLSNQDLLNIAKIEKERDKQRINNVGRIEKRNAERALALQNLREDLDSFDWNQVFIILIILINIFIINDIKFYRNLYLMEKKLRIK